MPNSEFRKPTAPRKDELRESHSFEAGASWNSAFRIPRFRESLRQSAFEAAHPPSLFPQGQDFQVEDEVAARGGLLV